MFQKIKDFFSIIWLRIFVAVAICLALVFVVQQQQVFLGASPTPNPFFLVRLQNIGGDFVAWVQDPLATPAEREARKVVKQLAVEPPNGLNFVAATSNVEAAEDPTTGEKYVRLKEGTKVDIIEVTEADGTVKKKIKVLPE